MASLATLLFVALVASVNSDFAYVKSFTAAGNRETGVEQGARISMSCRTAGYPVPKATLVKASLGDSYKEVKLNESYEQVEWEFRATCSRIGVYLCRASNEVQGNIKIDTKTLTIRAKCPPSVCHGVKSLLYFHGAEGFLLTVKLCIAAFPVPFVGTFRVQKAIAGWWRFIDLKNPLMELVTHDDLMVYMKLTYPRMAEYDFGFYRLLYKEDLTTIDRSVPLLKFHVIQNEHMSWMAQSHNISNKGVAVMTVIIVVASVGSITVSVLVKTKYQSLKQPKYKSRNTGNALKRNTANSFPDNDYDVNKNHRMSDSAKKDDTEVGDFYTLETEVACNEQAKCFPGDS